MQKYYRLSDKYILRGREKLPYAVIVEACSPGQALNDAQKYKKFPVRYVGAVSWSIGRRSYKCKHCYLSAPEAKFGELSHEQMMSIIPQLAECGIMNVNLTGGEPLVRDDFLEIVDGLLECRNIHPEFNMSYDGVGWYDWMRGIPGTEKAVDRAFALCRDMGFPTGAAMCLHRLNMHTIRESVNHLASLLDMCRA